MENKSVIMVVEDEKVISDLLAAILENSGYKVVVVRSGKEAISICSSHCPDLVLLDLGLPDIDGFEVLRAIRQWSVAPIIVVSARQQEGDKVQALDDGADDYVTKPFNNNELLARIRTAIRRGTILKNEGAVLNQHFQIDGLRIDYARRQVTLDELPVHLTPLEYRILTILSVNAGRVLTREYLRRELWGPYATDNRILRVNMANLRRKLEQNPADPQYIFTEIGVGYRMAESGEATAGEE